MKAFLITLLLLFSPTVDAKKKGSKKKKEPPKLEGDHASAALHLAAKKGHTKAVREILDAGVDPNAMWKGTTAMALAAGRAPAAAVATLSTFLALLGDFRSGRDPSRRKIWVETG